MSTRRVTVKFTSVRRLFQHFGSILYICLIKLPLLIPIAAFIRKLRMLDWHILGHSYINGNTIKENRRGMEKMKDPFDYWNRNAFLEYQEDEVRIYDMEGHKYLFIGQVMYASTTERSWYIRNVMPYAKGKCLEIGLGLGVASKCILAKDGVRHLLTIENNEKVIDAFGRPLRNHNILHMDINHWLDGMLVIEPFYDFIFVDHYAFDEEDLEKLPPLAERLDTLLRPGGNMVFWIDENAEEEDKDLVRGLWKISK